MRNQALQPRLIWQGPGWRLNEETAVLPDGRIMTISAVRHPGAVVLIPIRGSGSATDVLMLHQFRPVINQTILELPAGTLEWGESVHPAAQRELREETGLRAADFTPLGQQWPVPGSSDELMNYFIVRDLTPDPLPQDDDEVIETEWLPLDELVAMALDGRIRDGKTIIGLLRVAHHLRKNPPAA